MRNLDPDLKTHLASGATSLATCWRIARRDGAVLGFTDHNRMLHFDGTDFLPESGAIGSALATSADLAIDSSNIEGALLEGAFNTEALSSTDLAAGRYDGAGVEVFRVNWQETDQRALLKTGVIGEVRQIGEAFQAELRGITHELGQSVGRVYQRLCDVNVGSAACGIDLDTVEFKTTSAVTSVRDEISFTASGFSGFVDGWFSLGVLSWLTGNNAGLTAHVKTQTVGGAISLWLPAGATIEIGDSFSVTAGCDKRHATCRDKFSNTMNFRGQPFMPGNDFAISYPLRSDKNDGGKLK